MGELESRFVLRAKRIAVVRYTQARRDGKTDGTLYGHKKAEWLGALGEVLVADRLGLEPRVVTRRKPGAHWHDFVDLGGRTVEVRTRDRENDPIYGDLMALESRGMEADIAVLVWIFPQANRYQIVGWTTREEFAAKCVAKKRKDGKAVLVYSWRKLLPMCEISP